MLTNMYRNLHTERISKVLSDSKDRSLHSSRSRVKTSRVYSKNLEYQSPFAKRSTQGSLSTRRNTTFKHFSQPRCGNRSSMKRYQPSPLQASNRLYNDALRRSKSREKSKSLSRSRIKVYKSSKSAQYLLGQFLKDFNEIFPTAETGVQQVRVEVAQEIMRNLGFIRKEPIGTRSQISQDYDLFDQFWKEITQAKGKEKPVSRMDFLNYLIYLQGFRMDDISTERLSSLYFQVSVSNILV